jgi:hypothetical protein
VVLRYRYLSLFVGTLLTKKYWAQNPDIVSTIRRDSNPQEVS